MEATRSLMAISSPKTAPTAFQKSTSWDAGTRGGSVSIKRVATSIGARSDLMRGLPGIAGPAGHDEINQARKAGNFGWPYFVGPNLPYHDVNFETGEIGELFDPAAPVNDSPNSKGVQTLPPAQPAFVYYHRNETEDFPMLRTGGRTACARPCLSL